MISKLEGLLFHQTFQTIFNIDMKIAAHFALSEFADLFFHSSTRFILQFNAKNASHKYKSTRVHQ